MKSYWHCCCRNRLTIGLRLSLEAPIELDERAVHDAGVHKELLVVDTRLHRLVKRPAIKICDLEAVGVPQ